MPGFVPFLLGNNMKQRVLVSSIIMGLYASLAVGSAMAQSADDQQEKKKETTELKGVVVTGSLIPRAQIETASPTISITSDEMNRQGFKSVYDALRSMPVANGAVLNSQVTNGFSPAANTVSILGLDPSFTLVLLNGRPISEYPFSYGFTNNFVDLSNIPTMLVDHIDILPGNQSAIYGSSAIAGVVNVITKQHIEGVDLRFRVGGYTQGGGQQQKLELSGGKNWGALNVLFALQLENSNAVYAKQRDYLDSLADDPTLKGKPPLASRDRVVRDAFTNKYVDPGAATCAAISNLFYGDEKYRTRPGSGNYCGSLTSIGLGTLWPQNKNANGYLNATYELNDTTQLYGDFLYGFSKTSYAVGGNASPFWSYGVGSGGGSYFYDIDSKHLLNLAQHIFAPEEIGSVANPIFLTHSYVVNFGARGTFGSSNWNYDAYFHRSENDTYYRQRRPLTAKVNAFFLGPQDGTDPYGYGYPAYHLSKQGHFWGAITPADFQAFSADNTSNSSTHSQTANLTVTNTDLFSLPAGSVGFAGLVEFGDQAIDNPLDPRIVNGDFFGLGGTSSHGTRDHQGAGFEFNVPLFSKLTADLSGRYDRYDTGYSSQGKFTYKLGLEFRPIDTLLVRGNYATAFKAPDIGQVFASNGKAYTSVTDYYNCRKIGGDNFDSTTCPAQYQSTQIELFNGGDRNLKYITSKSWGYGFVWSPTSNFNIKLDYIDVRLKNKVNLYDADTISRIEADCLIGHQSDGTVVDPNSARCKDFTGRVDRVPLTANLGAGTLISVTTFPINVASEHIASLLGSLAYKVELGRFGDVKLGASYSNQFTHSQQDSPLDPPTDVLRYNGYGNQFKNIGNASVEWDIGAWSFSAIGTRTGKTFNYKGTGTVGPWMTYNGSIQYNFSDDASMTLLANNIFDSRPPRDNTFSAWPYFDFYSYNGLGRIVWLQMDVHFGGSKK